MTPWFPQSGVLRCHGYFLRVRLSFPLLCSPHPPLFLCVSLWRRGGHLLQPHTLRKVCVLGVLLGDALLCVTHLVLKEPLLDIPGGPVVRDPPTCGIREAPTHREQPSSHNTTSEPAHLESVLGSKSHHHKEERAHSN